MALPKKNAINCFAVVRGNNLAKVKTALCDLVRFAHLTFADQPRRLGPSFADDILVKVMKSALKNCCESAAIVPLTEQAGSAIGRIRKIHPPAHVIIISPIQEIFHELINYIDILPEIDLTVPKAYSGAVQQIAEVQIS